MSDQLIVIDGCNVSETGLTIDGELTQHRWEEIGKRLAFCQKGIMWLIGDWLLAGEQAGYLPRGKLQEACDLFGIALPTAKQAAYVCRHVERSLRNDQLEFHHHRIAVGSDDTASLLGWAIENNATVAELKAEKKRRSIVVCESPTTTTDSLEKLIESGQKFGTIYADPPWQYGNQATRASTDNHYTTMPKEAIENLPIQQLTADKCHLHLWTTNGFLKDAFDLIDKWGFEFKSTFVWVKPQLGMGNYWRCSHEIMLLGVKGGLTFEPSNVKSWIEAPRTKHSAKPQEVRKLIERFSPAPRLELFSRNIIDGWVMWGNQIERGMFDEDVQAV